MKEPELAQWWKANRERHAAKMAKLQASGLAKLTEAERGALNLTAMVDMTEEEQCRS